MQTFCNQFDNRNTTLITLLMSFYYQYYYWILLQYYPYQYRLVSSSYPTSHQNNNSSDPPPQNVFKPKSLSLVLHSIKKISHNPLQEVSEKHNYHVKLNRHKVLVTDSLSCSVTISSSCIMDTYLLHAGRSAGSSHSLHDVVYDLNCLILAQFMILGIIGRPMSS